MQAGARKAVRAERGRFAVTGGPPSAPTRGHGLLIARVLLGAQGGCVARRAQFSAGLHPFLELREARGQPAVEGAVVHAPRQAVCLEYVAPLSHRQTRFSTMQHRGHCAPIAKPGDLFIVEELHEPARQPHWHLFALHSLQRRGDVVSEADLQARRHELELRWLCGRCSRCLFLRIARCWGFLQAGVRLALPLDAFIGKHARCVWEAFQANGVGLP
mmetsp:Transcript_38143/g.95975  ORF Transcript_38143/g.95975 Transcript_38143/m.95975 type:complete len:216 (-) Transcript_38143:367-1014(-)